MKTYVLYHRDAIQVTQYEYINTAIHEFENQQCGSIEKVSEHWIHIYCIWLQISYWSTEMKARNHIWLSPKIVPLAVFKIRSEERERASKEGAPRSLNLWRKYSINEQAVTACILHFKVPSTRSSILFSVLPSKTKFFSRTCQAKSSITLRRRISFHNVRAGQLWEALPWLTCKSKGSGTKVSSIFEAKDKHDTAKSCAIQGLPSCHDLDLPHINTM